MVLGEVVFALPQMILFYLVWTIHMIFRPLIVLTLLAALTSPLASLQKVSMMKETFQFWIFSKDKKWKKTSASDTLSSDFKLKDQKTIIFLRHGESSWNDTFNKGSHRSAFNFALYFIPNLIYALFMEWFFFVTGQASESWFYDAPLSSLGLSQAKGVQEYLATTKAEFLPPQERKLFEILKNSLQSSKRILVTSPLRRAISTILTGLQDTLVDEKVAMWSSLQEISVNPDALCITPAGGPIVSSWTDPPALEQLYKAVDAQPHLGNKAVTSNGGLRMPEFCKDVFAQTEADAIIAAGHSLWFRSFFQGYLPGEHVAKKRKLVNGGLVGFTLECWQNEKDKQPIYRIDPKSMVVLHGGF